MKTYLFLITILCNFSFTSLSMLYSSGNNLNIHSIEYRNPKLTISKTFNLNDSLSWNGNIIDTSLIKNLKFELKEDFSKDIKDTPTDPYRLRDSISKAQHLERVRLHKEMPNGSLQKKYFYYCHKGLTTIPRNKTYPNERTEEFCSIKICFQNLVLPEICEIVYKRLIEISNAYSQKNIYLYLLLGSGSVDQAEQKNKNIKDDRGLIYISVHDILIDQEKIKAVEIYNKETIRLLNEKSGLRK